MKALLGLVVTSLVLVTAVEAVAQTDMEPENRFGLSQPKPKPPGAVRLATYNVLNLFDQDDDPTLSGRYDDLEMATSRDRCAELAEAIVAIDADVIALQEVESKQALNWFRETFLSEGGYEYAVSVDVGYYRGIENSVLSRHEITEFRVWPELSLDEVQRTGPGWAPVPLDRRRGLRFQRSPLMVDVKLTSDYVLTLFVVHHKSGRDFDYQREAEALRIVDLVGEQQQRDPSRNIAILGDFNAAPWDKSMRVYLEAGFIDTLAHRIIPRWREAPQDEARLYKTHESDRVLDYILLNSAAHRELVIGSPHVVGTLTPPPSYDWRTDEPPAGYASDHYPVVIDVVPRDRP
ncbi:MAG: endonuclease/exonuclease/phosphatase family protein [Planctomycetota bacterium]|jgi:endonuclease/exonuclease/phosphatase family metal-dependent hydrolase